ncbi:hypothetical protein [Microvirga flavescens]|uniref:hypothetical protein n=1 Tax=Microvirga flavescens TaxID=2249811 RepID=UPI00130039F5|nr:hypothetical protein [Microvirga flavescens]
MIRITLLCMALLTASAHAEPRSSLKISSLQWSAIRAAEAEALRFDPQLIEDMKYYEVWVYDEGDNIEVIFTDSGAFAARTLRPGKKMAKHFGFAVLLRKDGLTVVHSALQL